MATSIPSKIRNATGLKLSLWLAALLLLAVGQSFGQHKKASPKPFTPLEVQKGGTFSYIPDSLGNRLVDFSYCGYRASEEPIPASVPVKVLVPLRTGDATAAIQSALDYVGGLKKDTAGFRGTVQLEPGVYHIMGSLHMYTSGVVLKGAGVQKDGGTELLGAGTDRATLIEITGKKDSTNTADIKITQDYVPVNAMSFTIASTQGLKVGDLVVIHRPCTQTWIDVLKTGTFGGGLSALGWKPGSEDIFWSRKVTAIEGNTLHIDAPLTTALDARYGGGTVNKYSWPGKIDHVGVEHMRLVSSYDTSNLKDEDHRWMAITINNAADGWVRRIIFKHFAGSSVDILEGAERFTVEDCQSLAPVSEIGGQRRYTFRTYGQRNLFQRLYSEQGYHDFSAGFCAAGPNAFVQCEGVGALSYSGSVDSWASGLLFDVVRLDGQTLAFKNLEQDEQGAGWNAANSVFWNCYAAHVDCYQPPTAENYAFGTWAQFGGDGYWAESNNWIQPRSFYYTQLAQRLGRGVEQLARLMPFEGEASSSPTVEVAAELTKQAYSPATTMQDWIDSLIAIYPVSVRLTGVKTIDAIGVKAKPPAPKAPPMIIKNGWLVRANTVLTGDRQQVPWWFGNVQRDFLPKTKPAITRFVPGRTGLGLTDNLDSVTDQMGRSHTTVMEQNYALWYDRRRDDHERVRRQNGNVWPPFYELPFARSGQGIAWDGLSKYDLTKYNKWYWSRLKKFADLADEKGLVLIHHNYFQHNIIEAGAHYADFTWRPVNNINNTGFPEPVHFAGDKRLFMGEQFYDETEPVRRRLHQAYIDECLNNFDGNSSVIQFICEEYTGPLHFVRFWLDTILAWEKSHGKTGANAPTIGLSTTRDVQDSVLADPLRRQAIKVIDIRYWFYQANGTAYAPRGGQNLAPRQQARQFKPKNSSFDQVYRAVREYTDKYPDKAVMYSAQNFEQFAWASFMAGGSLAPLPAGLPKAFLQAASALKPMNLKGAEKDNVNVYALGNAKGSKILYVKGGSGLNLNSSDVSGARLLVVLDPQTGEVLNEGKTRAGNGLIAETAKKDLIYWIK